jgi:hypothetical protein
MFPRNQKVDHLFWDKLLLWHLELHKTFDLTHIQVFLAQPVIRKKERKEENNNNNNNNKKRSKNNKSTNVVWET